jgi:metal-responsive CopG/Arc/MetJ family transcriptional regulator
MPMQRVQLVMPQQMLDYLRKLAKERGTTVSELIRYLVQEKMDVTRP